MTILVKDRLKICAQFDKIKADNPNAARETLIKAFSEILPKSKKIKSLYPYGILSEYYYLIIDYFRDLDHL